MTALFAALLLVAPSAPIDATFAMRLRGERVGLLRVQREGDRYRYQSLTVVQREGVRTALTFTAQTDAHGVGTTSTGIALGGPLPSTLALFQFAEGEPQRCIAVEDERDGRRGEVCAQREGSSLRGTLLGAPFEARLDAQGPVEITLDQVRFERIDGEPPLLAPRDLFARPIPAGPLAALATQDHARIRGSGSGCDVDLELKASAPARDEPLGPRAPGRWEREAAALAQGMTGRWATARALARFVELGIASTGATPAEEDPAQVWRDRRGSCLGQARLFAALARGRGVPARIVYGALVEDGVLAAHAWAEVEVGGQWFGIDPSRGQAPVGLDHLPLAREGDPDPLRAGRCLLELGHMRWNVAAPPSRGR